jgi:hypothetical protein
MAGLAIQTIREAVKTLIDGYGITPTAAVHAYPPFITADNTQQYPCVLITHAAAGTEYATTFGPKGVAQLSLMLEIRTNAADPVSSAIAMDALLSAGTGATRSVFDAVASDPTLGGLVSTSSMLDITQSPTLFQGDGVVYWSAKLALTVYQPRS